MEKFKILFYTKRRLISLIQYMVFSVLLIIFVYFVDYEFTNVEAFLPTILTTSVDLSTTILSTLAGSLLTITTFTFTSILSVMSIQASNYSSYVIPNFIDKPIVMNVLGIFLGGFLYCITSLALMRDLNAERQVISGMIGIIYAIICVLYFIAFVRQVIYYSQDSNIIEDIYKETKKSINNELADYSDPSNSKAKKDIKIQNNYNFKFPLYATQSGYYSVLDDGIIASELGKYNGQLIVTRKVGEFVPAETEFGKVYITDEDVSKEDINIDSLEKAFITVDNEITINNYRYGLNKLTEIAIRSLSPSTPGNDTAIRCIHKLGLLLGQLSSVNYFHLDKENEQKFNIINSSYSFNDDLYITFSQITNYGKTDLLTMEALIDSCSIIYAQSTNSNKSAVNKIVEYLKEKLVGIYDNETDRRYLNNAFDRYEKIVKSERLI